MVRAKVPTLKQLPSEDLTSRIVERLSAVLSELVPATVNNDPLGALAELDSVRTAKVRLEQGILRNLLLKKGHFAECDICGERLPTDLLVAAHIKRRANCTDSERRAYKSNLMEACVFGCDGLFERGYLVVDKGRVARGPRKAPSPAVERKISALRGRPCARWNAQSKKFFTWHRLNVSRLR